MLEGLILLPSNLTQLQPNSGWCNVIFVEEMTAPPLTNINFSPTSTQPRAMKFGKQAQLSLLIKVGQEKSRVT